MSNASPNFSISVNLFRTPYITYKIEVAVSWRRSCGRGWLWEGTFECGRCGRVPDSALDVMDVAIGLNQRKLALLDDFWVKFGSQFRTFDVQVTATRPGETSEGLADEEEEEEEEGSFEVESSSPSLSFTNNKANDEEEEEQEEQEEQEKNKDMLSSVDKFSITSMDEVLQVNNILGSIADPLPKESQEGFFDAGELDGRVVGVGGATAGELDGRVVGVGGATAGELDGRVVGVGGATYVFPSYCSIVSEPDDCLTNKSITVGIQMAKCQWVLAWSSSELNGSLEHTENLLYFNELNYHPDTGFYELFLDSETIGEATGTYSIGICWSSEGFNESYSFSSFVSSCLFFNKETLSWSSEGCRVVGANTTITTCACNHLTSFGSGFFVAPNAIDFSYVFANAGFLDNLTIYLTLIISLALYFIGLVYARIKHCITITREGGREGEGREVERERSGQGDKWTGREEEREINGGEERVERKDEERKWKKVEGELENER
ncbi:hypothetical protein Pmani_019486 [Petrolisthes manimaculis]|uniref:GAIN-B domain-containing protein n=1 Tax=Petrolisthes manimaculis TaxID=1843537 RepID=A0AAE1U7L8_9EUCA|nr:hypothetical protein Pmani_019486 [Petrolisthes manimaculis]